jgi:prepilin-type N-terminal cleavage/methylation domain-containing protein
MKLPDNKSGYTVLEVIVAIVILGFASAALFQALTNGDKLRARSITMQNVSVIVANETERIKNETFRNGTITDSSYKFEINGRSYDVNRKVIEPVLGDTVNPCPVELELAVKECNSAAVPFRFRMLQGCSR